MSEPVDLLAALQRSIDAARSDRQKRERERRRDDHAHWASACTCGMGEEERTGHYPEHEAWCAVPSPLDADQP